MYFCFFGFIFWSKNKAKIFLIWKNYEVVVSFMSNCLIICENITQNRCLLGWDKTKKYVVIFSLFFSVRNEQNKNIYYVIKSTGIRGFRFLLTFVLVFSFVYKTSWLWLTETTKLIFLFVSSLFFLCFFFAILWFIYCKLLSNDWTQNVFNDYFVCFCAINRLMNEQMIVNFIEVV